MLLTNKTLSVTSPVIPNLLGVSALVASKLSGTEGINQLFEYTIELRTDLALYGQAITDKIKLDDMAGRELTAHIELEGRGSFLSGALGIGAGERQISGVISKAEYLREEGRQHIFRMTIKPWLYLANLRSDCRIFQNKTVVDVLDSVLSYYPFSTKKRLIEDYPSIDCITQYNETDLAFVERLCQEYGINYHFEHGDGVHHLVLSDHNGAYEQDTSAAYHQISYYPIGHKIDEEYIHSFTDISQVVTGQFTTTDYDYTRPKANLAVSNSDPRNTGEAKHEQYVFHTAQGIDHSQPNAGAAQSANSEDETRGKAIARVRMQALRQHGHRSQGEGHVRGIVPASSFTLGYHPRSALNTEYIVLNAQLSIEDIGQATQPINAADHRAEQWKVDVAFTVQPSKEIIRPDITHDKPQVNGVETAIVVGPSDDTAASNIYTDYLGRIKIQFPWDRLGKSDQTSSIWLRTDAPWAGNHLGATFIPRIGQEVLVSFIGGDVDRPLVTGRVYNENNLPSWTLPSQQALSGFRSRELTDGGGNAAGGRSNHIILDDTDQKIQVQLKSDHQASQLSLGHITRIEDNGGRKDARGEGFELRTDGKGAVRAKDGLLITTEGRNNASAHITDMGETTARLQQSQSQHESLGDLAKQLQAQDADASQEAVSKALDQQAKKMLKEGAQGREGKDRAKRALSPLERTTRKKNSPSSQRLTSSSPAPLVSPAPPHTPPACTVANISL